MTLIFNAPPTRNQPVFMTRRQFPNNNGISNDYMGMPSRDGPSNSQGEFALARRFYLDYRAPATGSALAELYRSQRQQQSRPATSDTIVKTAQKTTGKPIPQNSSDLYIQRRKMLAIGQSSVTQGPIQLKGGEDKNYKNRALTRVKAGGSIAPPRSASKATGPSNPSILARKYSRK